MKKHCGWDPGEHRISGRTMSRWLAVFLFILCSLTLRQSAQTAADSTQRSKKPFGTPTNDPKGLGLADLLTNPRLKIRGLGTCLVPGQSNAKNVAQLSAEIDKEIRDEKAGTVKPCPIDLASPYISLSGIWRSEVPGVFLVSPEQVWIECEAQEKQCRVLRVRFDLDKLGVSIQGPDETDYQVISWDAKSLFATHDPDVLDRCHRSVLTINAAGGDASVSDIPTHEKGCEIFKDTNSYRLVTGNYYVDTTPDNNSPAVEP
jgi:hypothetical protein